MTLPTHGQLTPHELTQRIKDQALAVGFDLVGVAPVQESPELAFLSAGWTLDTLVKCTISRAAGNAGGSATGLAGSTISRGLWP